MRFGGTLEELQALVAQIGHSGDWSETDNAHRFDARNGAILNWYYSTGTLTYQGKKTAREALKRALEPLIEAPAAESLASSDSNGAPRDPAARQRVFVVHGHDQSAREQLELILHRLNLDPFVLMNTGGGGLTIIEALEEEIGPGPGRCRFGIVLMTPDDMGYAKSEGDNKAEPRARQNVVLEMGMLIAALGRPNVAILKKGHLEVPSDAQGILYLGFNDHVRETVGRLVDRLRAAGFDIDPGAITRASS